MVRNKPKIIFLSVVTACVLCAAILPAQEKSDKSGPRLRLERAEKMEIEGEGENEIWRVSGNVSFVQGEAYIHCERAVYRRDTEHALFYGPVTIYDGKHTLTAERVRYNGRTREEEAFGNVVLISAQNRLTAERMLYSQPRETAEAYTNVVITDLVEHAVLQGDKGLYRREDEYGRMEGSPVFIKTDSSGADSLFISGTVMQAWGTEDRVLVEDSVRIEKGELRGSCQRLHFFAANDSLLLEEFPVIWQNDQKMTADTISILLQETDLDEGWLMGDSRIVSLDSLGQDVITGNTVHVRVLADSVREVTVKGQASSMYHITEDEPGVNSFRGDVIVMTFRGDRLKRLRVMSDPGKSTGKFVPDDKTGAAAADTAGNTKGMSE